VVKAAIWTVVEHMYERNISLLYAGPITSASEVSSNSSSIQGHHSTSKVRPF
jgi:hypothetical protein